MPVFITQLLNPRINNIANTIIINQYNRKNYLQRIKRMLSSGCLSHRFGGKARIVIPMKTATFPYLKLTATILVNTLNANEGCISQEKILISLVGNYKGTCSSSSSPPVISLHTSLLHNER